MEEESIHYLTKPWSLQLPYRTNYQAKQEYYMQMETIFKVRWDRERLMVKENMSNKIWHTKVIIEKTWLMDKVVRKDKIINSREYLRMDRKYQELWLGKMTKMSFSMWDSSKITNFREQVCWSQKMGSM